MSTTKPEGYEPDLFSEHARLAQLGARVVDTLKKNPLPVRGTAGLLSLTIALGELHAAAQALGLLGEEAKRRG